MHPQIFIILLLIPVLGYRWMVEVGLIRVDPPPPLELSLVLFFVPRVVLMGVYWMACRFTRRRLHTDGAAAKLGRLDRLGGLYRLGIIGCLLLDTQTAWPIWVYEHSGLRSIPGLAELVILLPPLLMLAWGWWSYYPIERRLREASLIRQMDQGQAIYPVPGRMSFVWMEFRHKIAVMLLPMLFLLAWYNALDYWLPEQASLFGVGLYVPLLLMGTAGILLFAPLMISMIWDTRPMGDGPLRQELEAMCRQYRVGVRNILVWNTLGTMINGAVVGMVRGFRYILMTDALLDSMNKRDVQAVMAHELAHIHRRHILWMLLIVLVSMSWLNLAIVALLDPLQHALSPWGDRLGLSFAVQTNVLNVAGLVGGLVAWFIFFGWVSRRFERQADTFAVVHMALRRQEKEDAEGAEVEAAAAHTGAPVIQHEDAQAMADALLSVAALNHFSVDRHSWRHGSIQWRCDYLQSLPGRATDELSIDRLVHWIQTVSIVMLSLLLLVAWWRPDVVSRIL